MRNERENAFTRESCEVFTDDFREEVPRYRPQVLVNAVTGEVEY
jgi:hypothetical protein